MPRFAGNVASELRFQVNLNGHISFETELPVYRSNFVLPFGYKLVAVFLADVDTRLSGNVYYRYAQFLSRLPILCF